MKINNKLDDKVLSEIVKVLNNDGLIIFPTDTVYGIACNAFSDVAVKKLFLAKKRSFDKPINVLVDNVFKINLVVKNINEIEKNLITKYFPGNLTIIFDKKKEISSLLTSGKDTIGVRIPNNEVALKILASVDFPLACSSANISGECCDETIPDFISHFSSTVDILIYTGKCLDVASTIVRVEDGKLNVLREGSLKIY